MRRGVHQRGDSGCVKGHVMLSEYRKKAAIGLGYGLVALFVSEVLYNYTGGGFPLVHNPLTDVAGLILSIVGVILYIVGCWNYVKGKGYGGAWCLLGLAFPFGLIALACFPDKHKKAKTHNSEAESVPRLLLLNVFSSTAGLITIAIDLGFAVWAGIGGSWYFYLLNFILLYIASSIINTSYIEGLTRGYSYIFLHKFKGVVKALGINILTIISLFIAYFITHFVFKSTIQSAWFFSVCIILSTIIAFIDSRFYIAIERTRTLESIQRR